MRSVSSPTSQMGGGGGGGGPGMENNVTGNVSCDQMSTMHSAPSTPPPPGNNHGAPSSMGGGGGGGGANSAYIGSTNSSTFTTSVATSANSRSATATNATNASSHSSTVSAAPALNRDQVYTWIQELSSPDTREHALIELSRKREALPDLAPMLWHSFGTIGALLQEIVMIYPVINPPTLNVRAPRGVL